MFLYIIKLIELFQRCISYVHLNLLSAYVIYQLTYKSAFLLLTTTTSVLLNDSR